MDDLALWLEQQITEDERYIPNRERAECSWGYRPEWNPSAQRLGLSSSSTMSVSALKAGAL